MKYYLYQKTHLVTGLKYLGWTKNDPYKYQGSGTRWTAHCDKHGWDHHTRILFESESKVAVRAMGKILSYRWDVVKSKQWANLVPEQGQGGNLPAEHCEHCGEDYPYQVYAQYHGKYCLNNPNAVKKKKKAAYTYKRLQIRYVSCLNCLSVTDAANYEKYHNHGQCEERRTNKNRFKWDCADCGIKLAKHERKSHKEICARRKQCPPKQKKD